MAARKKTAEQIEADEAETAPAAPEIDDEAHYEVTVNKRVDLSHLFRDRVLRKGSKITVKGKVLKGILDNVSDIQQVAG